LEWVRDNIEHFGGDPNNVTICGQSGGGGKVNALMRMPSAKGLFHKGIIQSGSFRNYRDPKDSSQVGEQLAKKLGIGGDLKKLQELPFDQLFAAAEGVTGDLRKQAGDAGPIMGRFGWAPTADGTVITSNGAEDFSTGIPLIVGYTRNEMATSAFDPSVDHLTMDEAKARIGRMYPADKGNALLAEYQQQYPKATPAFLYSVIASMLFANGSIVQVEERATKASAAPVYSYRFDWCPDIYDKRLGAFHSLEIAFTFDNTDRWDSATGGGARPAKLAAGMSQAWINFARNGNPNNPGLPKWPAYSAEGKEVMIFDDVCKVLKAPDGKAHEILT
jgi:para-nitrobenzyl esterase